LLHSLQHPRSVLTRLRCRIQAPPKRRTCVPMRSLSSANRSHLRLQVMHVVSASTARPSDPPAKVWPLVSEQKRVAPFITRVGIRNYKSIGLCDVVLGNL